MSISVTQLTQLSPVPAVDGRPCFDPTGKTVIFERGSSQTDGDNWEFYTVPIDQPGTEAPFFSSPNYGCSRADWSWSSDNNGYQIAFKPQGAGAWRLGLINPTNMDSKLITVSGLESGDNASYPAWYPDGTNLAVTNYGNNQLIQVDSQTGDQVQPLTNLQQDWAGMCSVNQANPDNVAFAGQPVVTELGYNQKINRIYSISKPMGPSALLATNADGLFTRACWFSPDGTYVAYEGSATPNGPYQIWIQPNGPFDPSTAINVTNSAAPNQHPKWSPDGSSLVFAQEFSYNNTSYWCIMLADLGQAY